MGPVWLLVDLRPLGFDVAAASVFTDWRGCGVYAPVAAARSVGTIAWMAQAFRGLTGWPLRGRHTVGRLSTTPALAPHAMWNHRG